MKAQMKAADRSGAPLALIVGTDELAAGLVAVRSLREQAEQELVARAEIVDAREEAGGPMSEPTDPADRQRIPGGQTALRTDYAGELRAGDAGRDVALCGWVARRREHGEHLAFVDLRDHTGLVQCVVDGAVDVRSEYVVRVTGTVRLRPEGTVNPNLPTGEVEVGDCDGRGAVGGRAASLPDRRPRRRRRRERPAHATATSTCGASACSATCGCGPR